MSDKSVFFPAVARVFLGTAGARFFGLLRNIVFARILGPEDFGASISIALVFSFAEMMTDMGWEVLIVQSRTRNLDRLQSTIHSLIVLRSTAIAIFFFASSHFLAQYFGDADLQLAFSLLAVASIGTAFLHTDFKRCQRQLDFRPEVRLTLISEFLGMSVGLAFVLIYQSYLAMTAAVIMRSIVQLILSHQFARRKYRLGFDREEFREALAFGLPLIANGFILFFGKYGDRVILAGMVGLRELGVYSAVIVLLTAASTLLLKSLGSVFLPMAAKRPSDSGIEKIMMLTMLAVALLVLVFFSNLGGWISRELFGGDYSLPRNVILLLSVLFSLQISRAWITCLCLARGDTFTIAISNFGKLTGVMIAYFALQRGYGFTGLAASMIVGELVAFLIEFIRRQRYSNLPFKWFMAQVLISLCVLLCSAVVTYLEITGSQFLSYAVAGSNLVFLLLIISVVATLLRHRKRFDIYRTAQESEEN